MGAGDPSSTPSTDSYLRLLTSPLSGFGRLGGGVAPGALGVSGVREGRHPPPSFLSVCRAQTNRASLSRPASDPPPHAAAAAAALPLRDLPLSSSARNRRTLRSHPVVKPAVAPPPPPPPAAAGLAPPRRRAAQAGAATCRPAVTTPTPTLAPPSTLLASADALEALLAWADPPASARALGAGLYVAVCAHALAHGVVLQPVTAAAAVGGGVLAWSLVGGPELCRVRAALSAAKGGGGGGGAWRALTSPSPLSLLTAAAALDSSEARLAARVASGVHTAAATVAPAAAAAAVVAARRLTGRAGPAPALLAGAGLYALAAAAEARVASNTTLLGAAWVGAFAAGPLRGAAAGWLDALAEEAVRAAVAATTAAGPSGLVWAGCAALFTWAACETARPFTRGSLAAAAAGGALVWRAAESLARGRRGASVVVVTEDGED